jgi:hypothetical protein
MHEPTICPPEPQQGSKTRKHRNQHPHYVGRMAANDSETARKLTASESMSGMGSLVKGLATRKALHLGDQPSEFDGRTSVYGLLMTLSIFTQRLDWSA